MVEYSEKVKECQEAHRYLAPEHADQQVPLPGHAEMLLFSICAERVAG